MVRQMSTEIVERTDVMLQIFEQRLDKQRRDLRVIAVIDACHSGETGRVQRLALRTVGDLVPAARAVGHDPGVTRAAHRR